MKLSVVICTHNPRPEFLKRTIDALQAQTLPLDRWELIVVDNASDPEVAARFPLDWHALGRHVQEPRLGLTPARLRGIAEAKAELLVFVDDDNILAPDYLEQALAIGKEFPFLGAWGGSIEPEFETPPQRWILGHLSKIAVRPATRDRWSNAPDDWLSTPIGAGLCVRADIAREYVQKTTASLWSQSLGRIGRSGLGGGEDLSIVLTALEMNSGQGVFERLKLIHIIPSARLQEDYLLRITEGSSSSGVVVAWLHNLAQPPRQSTFKFTVLCLLALVRHGPREVRFRIAARRGRLKMLRQLSSA